MVSSKYRGFLVCFFPILFISTFNTLVAGSLSLSRQQKTVQWHVIDLTVSVKGTYLIKEEGSGTEGKFSFSAGWQGLMEADDDDFIIYHRDPVALEWHISEKSDIDGQPVIITETSSAVSPKMIVYHILRIQDSLHFSFEVSGLNVPLRISQKKNPLPLPNYFPLQRTQPVRDYDKFIIRGSNNVVIPLEAISNRRFEKTFVWEWKKPTFLSENESTSAILSWHSAEVRITVKPGLR